VGSIYIKFFMVSLTLILSKPQQKEEGLFHSTSLFLRPAHFTYVQIEMFFLGNMPQNASYQLGWTFSLSTLKAPFNFGHGRI
jgi:hypothetical protein